MKSKTRRTSKNTPTSDKAPISAALAGLAEALAVGHRPTNNLSPQDEALFRAFQSNLLSLISHELRTPLMGILNSLGLLQEGAAESGISEKDLVRMAHTNAQRLQRTLHTLLDLASLESGTFHARMRETDLGRLVHSRIEAHQSLLKDRDIRVKMDFAKTTPILGDPQRLGRAIDLALQAITPRVEQGSTVRVKVQKSGIEFAFRLGMGMEALWDQAWTQAQAGFQGGIASPASAFGGVMQSEQAFLTRMEEGLGSEFLLIFEIMRMHHGGFDATKQDGEIVLQLEIPELSSEEGLRMVLTARAYQVSTELGSVALVLISVPKDNSVGEFCAKLKESLFRSSDAVYPLPERHEAALVVDDCKAEDVPRLLSRLEKTLGEDLHFGSAHFPADGQNPDLLFDYAQGRLEKSRK